MKHVYLLFFLLSFSFWASAQVGVNTTTPQAMLDIPASSTSAPLNTDGILIPRIASFPIVNPTLAQHGMMVFLTETSAGNTPGFYYWDHATVSWRGLVGSITGGWALNGNPGINASNFVGSTNAASLQFRTDNKHRFTITPTGQGIFGPGAVNDGLFNRAHFELLSTDIQRNDFNLRHYGTDMPVFNFIRNYGSFASPAMVPNGAEIASIRFWSHTNGPAEFDSYTKAAHIGVVAESATGALRSGIFVYGSEMEGIYVNANGLVGIGTETPLSKLHVVGKIRMADGTQQNGRILRSDANGIASWADFSSFFGGTLNAAYDFGTAGAGRTITADAGAVTIAGTDGLVATGTVGVGAVAPTGTGLRMFWNPRKGAFRAGFANSDFWNDALLGEYSAAFGAQTRASGNYSFAAGYDTYANGEASAVFGYSNIVSTGGFATGYFNDASGSGATAVGSENTATAGGAIALGGQNNVTGNAGISIGTANTVSAAFGVAFGYINVVSGQRATSFGVQNTAAAFGETVLGIGATNYTLSANGASQNRTANATDRIFTIGNAIDANSNNILDASERRNAMVILKNGLATLPTVTNALINAETTGKAIVTKEWVQANSGGSLNDAYDNGGAGLGRTITADSGPLQISGTDGIISTGTYGAGALAPINTGSIMLWNPRRAAFRAGYISSAIWQDSQIGVGSIAVGQNSNASGSNAFAGGLNTYVNGPFSFGYGVDIDVNNGAALAIGEYLTVNGYNAVAFGQHNTATGTQSVVMGRYNTSQSYGETVIGIGATTYTTTPNGTSAFRTANATDRLFVIGNAIDANNSTFVENSERSNAMTVLKNGRVALGNIVPTAQLELSLNQAIKPGNANWTIASDERLKEIHGSYSKGLADISRLNPIRYNYRNVGDKTFETEVLRTEFAGFSAQEVRAVFPEAVGTGDDGYLNLNIHPILIASVNAFKELKSQNEILVAQNRQLNEKLERQQQLLEELTKRVSEIESR